MRSTRVSFFASLLVLTACGGSSSSPSSSADDSGVSTSDTTPSADGALDTTPADAPVADGSTDDSDDTSDGALDHGAPSTTYPAFAPAMGVVAQEGGTSLTAPVIVTVTWAGDTDADALEKFGDQIGDTAYWAAIGGDYGVGKASSGASKHVRLTDSPPATWNDTDVGAWVADHAAHGLEGFPAPTDQTIYVLYLQSTTSLLYSGTDMCSQGIGGYHTNTSIGTQDVAYAIIGYCPGDDVTGRTSTASHELIEASTDPYPATVPAWGSFTPATAAWALFLGVGSEVADNCERSGSSYYEDVESPFDAWVQRSWSNSSGKAGHNPCVPVPSGVYFNTTPLALEKVVVDLSSLGGSSVTHALGEHIKMGETKTFPIGFYSDGDTGGPWTISLAEGSSAGASHRLTATVDQTSGQNGEKAWITVTVNSVDSTRATLLRVTSQQGKVRRSMPILIGSE